MNRQLLALLVCPQCKGNLVYQSATQELVCLADKLAFPIIDGIPTMLVSEARPLRDDEAS